MLPAEGLQQGPFAGERQQNHPFHGQQGRQELLAPAKGVGSTNTRGWVTRRRKPAVTIGSRASPWPSAQASRASSSQRIATGWWGWSEREAATSTFTSGVMAAAGHRLHSTAQCYGTDRPPRR